MMSSAEAMRAGLPMLRSQGWTNSGITQMRHREADQPRLGFGAAAGRALIANLPARTGGGAGERRDRGRMIVRLDLDQDVDRLVDDRR